MRPTSWSFLPAIAVRSSSVSLPHFSRILPVNCFQLPSMRSQFMTRAPWVEVPVFLPCRFRGRRGLAGPLGPGGLARHEAVAATISRHAQVEGLKLFFDAKP